MTDVKNFELYFVVELLKSDTREFRQDSDQLLPLPSLKVCVLLPRDAEYVYNLAKISEHEISATAEPTPEPVLTPKGLAYVKKQLESGYEVPKLEVTEDEWTETEKKLEPGKAKGDWVDPDWGNTVDDKNKVNAETWDDEKETWENE
jgi:hypothetical protein